MKSIDTENYYYTQVFTDPHTGANETICFAENTKEATRKIRAWFETLKLGAEIREICLYHKNYKRKSRKMVLENNYIA